MLVAEDHAVIVPVQRHAFLPGGTLPQESSSRRNEMKQGSSVYAAEAADFSVWLSLAVLWSC